MNGQRQTCHCGHDRATHYARDGMGVREACLAMACECTEYLNEHEPKPEPAPKTPRRLGWSYGS